MFSTAFGFPEALILFCLEETELIFSVVQILMNHREAVGTMNMSMKDGTTPLMTAVKLAVEEMVGQLLNYQVEVNATDNKGSLLAP